MAKTDKKDPKKTTLNLSIDKEKKKKLQKLAIDRGVSACELVEDSMKSFLGI